MTAPWTYPADAEAPASAGSNGAESGQSRQSRQPSDPGASGTTGTTGTTDGERRVRLTPAADIPLKVVRWCWEGRLPAGQLTLLGGREGIGKSLWQSHLAARLTRGTLLGEHYGTPRAVLIVASEDDWPRTVAPRLVAAGADLARVYRVQVTAGEQSGSLTLPLDVERLERAVRAVAASCPSRRPTSAGSTCPGCATGSSPPLS